MEKPELEIIIVSRQPWLVVLQEVLKKPLLLVTPPTAVGYLLGSDAMQWLGFAMSVLIFIAYAAAQPKLNVFRDASRARRYIAELQADGRLS